MTPLAAEVVLPGTLEDFYPTVEVTEVLGNLEPKEEVIESSEAGEGRMKARAAYRSRMSM